MPTQLALPAACARAVPAPATRTAATASRIAAARRSERAADRTTLSPFPVCRDAVEYLTARITPTDLAHCGGRRVSRPHAKRAEGMAAACERRGVIGRCRPFGSYARNVTTLPLIACSLDATGQKQRLADWSSLLAVATRREETTVGVRYSFVAGDDLESRLRTLVAAEKACCAFLDFNVVRTGNEIEMAVTAPRGAAAALRFILSAS
jgi:hypothetical protein